MKQHQTQILCIVKEAVNEIKWPRMEWKKINLQITYLVRNSYQVYIRDSCNSVEKKIKQLKYLNEQRKSKCFEKCEDQTVDERHFKFYLPKQKPLSSWHSFFLFPITCLVIEVHSIYLSLNTNHTTLRYVCSE